MHANIYTVRFISFFFLILWLICIFYPYKEYDNTRNQFYRMKTGINLSFNLCSHICSSLARTVAQYSLKMKPQAVKKITLLLYKILLLHSFNPYEKKKLTFPHMNQKTTLWTLRQQTSWLDVIFWFEIWTVGKLTIVSYNWKPPIEDVVWSHSMYRELDQANL